MKRAGLIAAFFFSTTSATAQEMPGPMAAEPNWIFSGDARVRGERIEELPGGREDIDRLRGFVRAAATYVGSPGFEVGFGIKLAQGSDDNDDNVPNFDNERSDDASVDRAFLRWFFSPNGTLTAGKDQLGLALSPMVWDSDVHPIGVSADWSSDIGDYDQLRFSVGYFDPDHELGGDARLAAGQLSWLIRPGATHSGALRLGYLDYTRVDGLLSAGLGRTNAQLAGDYASDFELLTLDGRYRYDASGTPLTLRLDLVHNLGAADNEDGARFSVSFGDARRQGAAEAGFIWQRIQRDAVLAAFNNDDWWFHSHARGAGGWLAYGLTDQIELRGTYFYERRDPLDEHLRRFIVDLIYRR